MALLKDIYTPKNLNHIVLSLKKVYPQFNTIKFKNLTHIKILKNYEMKDRVKIITKALHASMDLTYNQSLNALIKSLKYIDHDKTPSLLLWPYMQFIEDYGLVEIDKSMKAIEKITPYFTGEFAMRIFLNHDDKLAFKYITKWAVHKNEHLRRLASECIRPNLPWGVKVEKINSNLSRNIKVLKKLYYDESDYVRKSVANHLNDIARLDLKLFYKTIKDIDTSRQHSIKLIRHAGRSLIKSGDPKILKILGYKKIKDITVNYKLAPKIIKEGDELSLELKIKNNELNSHKILIEYIIYFPRKNGEYLKKAFRLSDTLLVSNEKKLITKRIPFKKVTTRAHYPGLYIFSIQINGIEYNKTKFKLRK